VSAGQAVDHVIIFGWIQRYAPEIKRRMRSHLKMSGMSYRLDEIYVKVGAEWKYLYRAVDSTGQTSKFMLSAKLDVSAAKRFCKKLLRAGHRLLPLTISTVRHRQACLLPGSLRHFNEGESSAIRLQVASGVIPQ
jgi:transposase, IS6 family